MLGGGVGRGVVMNSLFLLLQPPSTLPGIVSCVIYCCLCVPKATVTERLGLDLNLAVWFQSACD